MTDKSKKVVSIEITDKDGYKKFVRYSGEAYKNLADISDKIAKAQALDYKKQNNRHQRRLFKSLLERL